MTASGSPGSVHGMVTLRSPASVWASSGTSSAPASADRALASIVSWPGPCSGVLVQRSPLVAYTSRRSRSGSSSAYLAVSRPASPVKTIEYSQSRAEKASVYQRMNAADEPSFR